MTSYVTDGTVGPWAKEKLGCLRDYLEAYTTVLKGQSRWCEGYYFVDAFAGAGRAPVRKSQSRHDNKSGDLFGYAPHSDEEREYVDGSPRVALSIKHPFSAYLFVEKDEARAEHLHSIRSEYPDRVIRIRSGDANEILLNRLVKNPRIDWQRSRAIVFLDPFGMQVSWDTIQELAGTGAIEVIINNPIQMAIQRLLRRDGDIPKTWRERLDNHFGSDGWQQAAYHPSKDLFGERSHKVQDSSTELARLYNGRLASLFGHAASPRLVRNTRGSPLYYLHWAGPNATGLRIAEYVLGQGETLAD